MREADLDTVIRDLEGAVRITLTKLEDCYDEARSFEDEVLKLVPTLREALASVEALRSRG